MHDVIVIGAGPSGALAAYLLAKKGFSVLLLEKHRLPRYKACGGGVTEKAVKLLDFSIRPVVREATDTVTLQLDYRQSFSHRFGRPVIFMVMRDEFDHFLACKAVERGAELRDSTRVTGIRLTADQVEVEAGRESFRGRFLVGAGGVHGIVGKSLGMDLPLREAIAIVSESYPDHGCRRFEEFHNQFVIDFTRDEMRHGYGWIFPKGDHLSPGVYTIDLETLKKTSTLKEASRNYFRKRGIDSCYQHGFRGHPIPRGGKKAPLHKGRALLVGDEGAICDPLTGEGIHFGMMSAEIAAQVLERALQNGNSSLASYSRRTQREIVSDLAYARFFAYALYRRPRLSWHLALSNLHLTYQLFAQLIVGEITYKQLLQRTLPILARETLLRPLRAMRVLRGGIPEA